MTRRGALTRIGLGLAALTLICGGMQTAAERETGRPDDLAGWRAARWDMSAAELESAFGDSLTRLPGRWQYGGAYAELMLPEVEIGGVGFRALFQMNERSDRLQQVLLERRRVGATPINFERVVTAMERRLGPPEVVCAVPGSAGGALSLELRWSFPTTTVHLSFVDFQTTGVFSRDPNQDIDPLVPYRDVRRNLHRFMPRRILLRYHPSGRADLAASGGCPAADGR